MTLGDGCLGARFTKNLLILYVFEVSYSKNR